MLALSRPQAIPDHIPHTKSICQTSISRVPRQDKSEEARATLAMVRGERRSSHGTVEPHVERHQTAEGRVINVRVSMEDYYETRRESFELDQPPSYDAFLLPDTVLERRKHNIQPREDEGKEILPAYSCGISLETVFQRKSELEGAVHRAQDRNWNKVFATLQGTALSFYRCKGGSPFNLPVSAMASPDMPTGVKKAGLIKSYNLQHADVGIASDYHKKRYVIRVRAEADQFLLSCHKIETFVLWLQSLFTAIDLALPLDERHLPRDLSIPRPRRRRPARTTQINMDRNTALVAEQEEIMRTQFPHLQSDRSTTRPERPLVGNSARTAERRRRERERERQAELERQRVAVIPEDSPRPSLSTNTSSSRSSFIEDSDLLNTPAPPTRTNSSTSSLPPPSSAPMTRAMAARSLSDSANILHPSIEPETGKWQPFHNWGPLYDMQYAKRCMATLTERSPRKNNLVVLKGRLWVVDWATGRVERWEPPRYEELMKAKKGDKLVGSKLKINQQGELVAV